MKINETHVKDFDFTLSQNCQRAVQAVHASTQAFEGIRLPSRRGSLDSSLVVGPSVNSEMCPKAMPTMTKLGQVFRAVRVSTFKRESRLS